VLDAAPDGFIHSVLNREIEAPQNARIGLDAGLFHLVDRPDPGVVFFFAAFLVFLKADDMVAYFMEENGQADRRSRVRGFHPVHRFSIGVVDLPGAAAHGLSPALDAKIVAPLHVADDLLKAGAIG